MSLGATPTDTTIADKSGNLTATWQAFLSSVAYWLRPVGTSGPTGGRPVNTSTIQLYVGQSFFDTTLGKPIWVKTVNPTGWVDATGSSV